MLCRILALLIFLGGCGGGSSTEQSQPRVINGSPLGDEFPEATKLYLRHSVGWSFCSGVWIGQSHLLTAAHCVIDEKGLMIEQDAALVLNHREDSSGLYQSSMQIVIHPQYDNGAAVPSESFPKLRAPAFDIAVLAFQNIDARPLPSLSERPPSVGEPLVFVGFGRAESGPAGIGRIGFTEIEAIDAHRLYWRFDEDDESNSCIGDSGGPTYVDRGEGPELVALISGGTSLRCGKGDLAYNVRLDTVIPWLVEVTAGDLLVQSTDTSRPQEQPRSDSTP